MAEHASGSTDPEPPAPLSDGAPVLPDRVKNVLQEAADFAGFKRTRAFKFLHLFAGKNDVLGKKVQEEAAKSGIRTVVRAVDRAGPNQEDMLADEPCLTLLAEAKAGDWDAGHAGPPCQTFSAARWNAKGPGPPPVRSKTEIYGLETNSASLQRQADQGTLLATRSCSVIAEVVNSPAACWRWEP